MKIPWRLVLILGGGAVLAFFFMKRSPVRLPIRMGQVIDDHLADMMGVPHGTIIPEQPTSPTLGPSQKWQLVKSGSALQWTIVESAAAKALAQPTMTVDPRTTLSLTERLPLIGTKGSGTLSQQGDYWINTNNPPKPQLLPKKGYYWELVPAYRPITPDAPAAPMVWKQVKKGKAQPGLIQLPQYGAMLK